MPTVFAGAMQTAPIGPFASSSSSFGPRLGELIYTDDGRGFRYCLVGASALVPGKLYQAPAEVTNHQDLTPVAAAIGATSVTVALGATAATADQYAGGFMVVTVTPGQGYTYRISSNPAAALSTSMALTLSDPLQVALTTSSRIDLFPSPFSGVIVNPASASSAPVGVAVYAASAASYAWLQVSGPVAILADGANAVGASVVASNAVAGAVEDAAGSAQAIIGTCLTGAADTEYGLVQLSLA